MTERDWEAAFHRLLKREQAAHSNRIAAALRIHRDKNNEALYAAGDVFDRYDRARESLDEFMLEYGQYLRTSNSRAEAGERDPRRFSEGAVENLSRRK